MKQITPWSVGLAAAITALIACFFLWPSPSNKELFVLGLFAVVLLTVGLRCLTLVVVLAASLQAQDASPVPGYQQPAQFSLALSMPQHPGEESPIIVGAICVGVAAGIVGWIGVELINKCLKVYEHQVTNNVPFQAQGSPTSPTPIPDPGRPTPAVTQVCIPCSDNPDVADDAPLPILIETSSDGQTWSAAAVGLTRERFYIPSTGFWRASLMPLTISLASGVATVHAPPGVLEFSPDLRGWSVLSVNHSPITLAAQSGFYRMRL